MTTGRCSIRFHSDLCSHVVSLVNQSILARLLCVDQTLVEEEQSTLVPVIAVLFIDIEEIHFPEFSLVEDVELEEERIVFTYRLLPLTSTYLIAILNVINVHTFINRVQQLLHILLRLAANADERLQGLVPHILQQLDDHLIEQHFIVRQSLDGFHQKTIQSQAIANLLLSSLEKLRIPTANVLGLCAIHRIQHVLVEIVLLDELTKHFTDFRNIPITVQQLW